MNRHSERSEVEPGPSGSGAEGYKIRGNTVPRRDLSTSLEMTDGLLNAALDVSAAPDMTT
ncbi:MAG: hypothetical protein H0U99_10145 [Chthoniobacterales bacterium]|nr:hypothetical protein [Chthoniobacterales bacterium]